MNILYMKQKVFSFKERFTIKDEDENDKYFVEGKTFSLGHELHVFDTTGNEIAYIKQKPFSLKAKYNCFINNLPSAEITKEFTLIKQKFTVVGPEWLVEGDFYDHNYSIVKSEDKDHEIALINKAYFSWGYSYKIDIFDEEEELRVLLVCLAIDCVLADADAAANAAANSD